MKTPEDIKKGLECCMHEGECKRCPYQGEKCTITASGDALAYIRQLEVAQPKWISVEEKLPERTAQMCAIYANGYVQAAEWHKYSWADSWWFYVDGEYEEVVTHWMPLPELPKEV